MLISIFWIWHDLGIRIESWLQPLVKLLLKLNKKQKRFWIEGLTWGFDLKICLRDSTRNAELTWVLTRGWLSALSYFKIKKGWSSSWNTNQLGTWLERTYKPHYHYQNFSPLANGTDLNREKYTILQTHWH